MNESIRIRSRSLSAWDQRTGHEPRVVALRAGRRTNVNSPSGRTRRMAELPDERQLVLGARSQLDRWTKSARREAYVELFDGDDPVLSPEEMQLLDALDSELERQGGDGVWGPISTEFTRRGPRVRIPHSGWSASTIHRSPQIPSSAEGTTSTTRPKRAQRRALEIQRARRDTHRNTTQRVRSSKLAVPPIRSLSVIERIYLS